MEDAGENALHDMEVDQSRAVNVRFVTKIAEETMHLPDKPFVVPAALNRRGLSKVVNQLLKLDPPRIFDFLANDVFLRSTLEDHIKQREKEAPEAEAERENVIVLEYLEAQKPPQPSDTLEHDDWVSAISARIPGWILTGCYDNKVRLWKADKSSQPICIEGHEAAITDVSFVSKEIDTDGSILIASTSKDETTRLWRVSVAGKKVEQKVVLTGHGCTVESVAVEPRRSRIATGGWDNSVKLWNIKELLKEAAEPGKKRRTEEAKTATEPLCSLSGHTQCVSALLWPTPHQVISASWDNTVRLWDVDTQSVSSTLNGGKAVTCVAYSAQNALLATSHHNNFVSVWDPRVGDAGLVKKSYASHGGWVSDVSWHPVDEHVLVSSSHDNTLKLWDLRTDVALATVTSHTDKVLCVEFDRDGRILSGGADSKLRIHSIK